MGDCNAYGTPMDSRVKMAKDDAKKIICGTMYGKLVGSLIYLTITRPYICHVVGTISRFMVDPIETHYRATQIILRSY